jgi:hypothetical protein
MKRSILNLLMAISTIPLFCSCMSNETKALKLIDNYMKSYLIVYDSYNPQATQIDTAYYYPTFDATVLSHAKNAIDAQERYEDTLESIDRTQRDVNSAKRRMAIWNDRSSAIAREEYNQALQELNKANAKIIELTDLAEAEKQKVASEEELIKEAAAQIPSGVCGWLIQHSYTCKTRGGLDTASSIIMVTNPDFTEIFFAADNEDTEIVNYINKAKEVLNL